MLETKEHYKMYKDGKHWVAAKISTVAGVALFSTMILGGGHISHVNADSVSTTQTSQFTSDTNESSKSSVPVVNSNANSTKGISVNVPHQNLDKAVSDAKDTSVNVTSGSVVKDSNGNTSYQTTSKTESAINVHQDATQDKPSTSDVSQDYQKQTSSINNAVNEAKTNVKNYETQVSDAVKKNQQIVSDYNSTKSTIENNNSKLTQAANDAKSMGVTVTTNNSKTVNNTTDANNDFNSNSQAIAAAEAQQKQYNDEYQKELADYKNGTTSNNELNSYTQTFEKDIQAAKDAGVQVIMDPSQTVNSVNDGVDDYTKQINSLTYAINNSKNYQEAEKDITDYVNGLNSAMQKVNDKFHASVNSTGVDPSTINQKLSIAKEPQATCKILTVGNGVQELPYHGVPCYFDQNTSPVDSKESYTFRLGNKSCPGTVVSAEWDGLQNSTYDGTKISKVVETFSNFQVSKDGACEETDDWPNGPSGAVTIPKTAQLTIYNDPWDGFGYSCGDAVTVDYKFYDQNGNLINFKPNTAWMTAALLHQQNGLSDTLKLNSAGSVEQIKGSSVSANGNTLSSESVNSYSVNGKSWIDNPLTRYFGAGLVNFSGNDLNLTYGSPWVKGYYGVTQGNVITTLPYIPSQPQPVHVHLNTVKNNGPAPVQKHASVSYNLDNIGEMPTLTPLPTYTPTDVHYHYDTTLSEPTETKDVDAGNITGTSGTSVNGKEVEEGENVTFPLKSSPLPAGRTDDAKSMVITDTLDNNVKFNSWKAVDSQGNDVTKDFTLKQDGQNLTFTANDDFIKSMNIDKSKEFEIPTIDIYATATASGVTVNNTFKLTFNGQTWNSNQVSFSTPKEPQPVKTVDNANGQDINGNFVEPGQETDFNLTMDLSGDKNVVLDKDTIAKGLSMIDNVDKRLTPNINNIKITDENGKEVDKNLFNITNNNNEITIAVKDPQAFLNTYGGQKLIIKLPAIVNKGISGNIPNTVVENHFGNDVKSNQVIIYVPNPTKGVSAGIIQGTGSSIDGKEVTKGENVTFSLNTTNLPAGRKEDVKNYQAVDTLDPNFNYTGYKAYLNGKDVTSDFTMTKNGNTVTLTASADLIKEMNADKSKDFVVPTIDIYGTAKASGVTIKNNYKEVINNDSYTSNTVTISTPKAPQPVKTVNNDQGQDIDGTFVEPGQDANFNLTFDLSGDKDLALDKDMITKGLSMTDNVDKRLTPNVDGIKITDANGKEVAKNLFNITDNNNDVTIAVKDPQAFLNTYGGQKLNIFLPAKVNTGITGNIPNTATENHFGDDVNTNQVVIYAPAPHKDVVAGTVQGTGTASINGNDVVAGQNVTFTLTTSDLPAGRKADVKSYSITDELDSNFDYSGFKAFLGSTDVTNEFTSSLVKGQNGKWTLTLTANADMLKQMNADKSKAFTIPTFDLYGKAINSGVKIQNTYTEHLNGNSYNSNTVVITTTPTETPVKTVTNAAGQDADNGNVERGDSLIYHVSMNLDGMPSTMVLTPDTIQKGLWVSDKMPAGVTVNTAGIRVNSADGKDITSDFTITCQNGVVKVAAKDPASIIKQFGNTKLSITIPTTVNDNFVGDIKNTAQQNTFGNITTSNTVVDHVPPMAPSKDVVVDLGNQNSLNGKSIALNSTFDYKLNSSTRPADYVGQTTEWGGKDMIDVKHDEFTGQWQVIADHPFVLKDGTTVKAGSDISKYFTMTFNDKTGEFDIEANKDFLDIMNLPANKKTEQGWSVFLQCKRIATGTAHNVWTETYNGKPVQSNTVTTTTPAPKKPATPKKSTPTPQKVVEKQVPATPAPVKETPASTPATPAPAPAQPVLATPAPVKETPAPEKQVMPQTGESENDEGAIIGLAMLGAVGTMGLALKKKRYED